MKNIRLPDDIKRLIARQTGIKELIFIAFLVGEAILFYVAGDYLLNGWGTVNTVAIFIAITAFAFWVSKLHTLIIDRAWQGEVTHTYVETFEKLDDHKSRATRRYVTVNQTNAIIKCENGKSKTIPIPKGIPCQVGDTAIHIKGLKSVLILHEGNNKYGICVVCGAKNQTDTRCGLCGHTIIKKHIA